MMTQLHSIKRVLWLAVLVAFLAGCAGTRTQESTGEYVDDTTITTKVKAALLKDEQVSGLAINVETFKGVVQLSGFAKTDAERRRAVQLTRDIGGVKSVKNDILLK